MNSCIFLAIYGICAQLTHKSLCDVEGVFVTHLIIIKCQVPAFPIVVIFSGDVCLSVFILTLCQLLHIGKPFLLNVFSLLISPSAIVRIFVRYHIIINSEIWMINQFRVRPPPYPSPPTPPHPPPSPPTTPTTPPTTPTTAPPPHTHTRHTTTSHRTLQVVVCDMTDLSWKFHTHTHTTHNHIAPSRLLFATWPTYPENFMKISIRRK